MTLASAYELTDEVVQWRGQFHGFPSELQGDLVAVVWSVGELGDPAGRLSTQQQEQPGRPVDGVQTVIVGEAPYQCPSLVLSDDMRGEVPRVKRNMQRRGVTAPTGPEQEGADIGPLGGSLDEPDVHVLLRAPGEAGAVFMEPFQQQHEDPDVMSGTGGLSGGDIFGVREAAQAPQRVPHDTAAQDLAFGGVFDTGVGLGQEGLQRDQLFVAGGQGAADHQHGAQMLGALDGWEPVENLVGDRPCVGSQGFHDRPAHDGLGDPPQQSGGWTRSNASKTGLSSGRIVSRVPVRTSHRLRRATQAVHSPRWKSRSTLPHSAQERRARGAWPQQVWHSGSPSGRPITR